jgi:hypothetical protein
VSLTNEYHWGDFKGDPAKLMRHYFDAHVYFANWCQCYLALRVPYNSLKRNILQEYQTEEAFICDATKKHWIMYWSLNESQNYERFAIEDGRGWMAKLSLLREELLCGDLRPLYLGWLSGVTAMEIDDESLEPPVPAGLGQLSASQQALVEFIEIDPDLLTAAAMGSEDLASKDTETNPETIVRTNKWIESLPSNLVAELMRLLLAGKSRQAEHKLKARYAAWQRSIQPELVNSSRRAVTELRQLAHKAEQNRLLSEKRAKTAKKAKQKKQREAYLYSLAANFSSAWKTASQNADRGTASAYDEACRCIIDLSEAYALKNAKTDFQIALRRFMRKHSKRPALKRRLIDAGVWTR